MIIQVTSRRHRTWGCEAARSLLTALFVCATLGFDTALAQDSTRVQVWAAFSKMLEMSAELDSIKQKAGGAAPDISELRVRVLEFQRTVFTRQLKFAKDSILKHKDRDLLARLVAAVIAVKRFPDIPSRYETFALGDIFLREHELLVQVYRELDLPDRRTVFPMLETGFMTSTYRDSTSTDEYEKLKEMLLRLDPRHEQKEESASPKSTKP